MKLRYLLPALAIGAASLPTLQAQTPPPPPPPGEAGQKPGKPPRDPKEMAQKRVEMMTKALNLTPEQSSQITAIMAETGPAMKALHEDSSLDKDQKRTKMKELREGVDSKISAVLTPEQNAKWQEQREKMKERREKGAPAGAPEASPTATPN